MPAIWPLRPIFRWRYTIWPKAIIFGKRRKKCRFSPNFPQKNLIKTFNFEQNHNISYEFIRSYQNERRFYNNLNKKSPYFCTRKAAEATAARQGRCFARPTSDPPLFASCEKAPDSKNERKTTKTKTKNRNHKTKNSTAHIINNK